MLTIAFFTSRKEPKIEWFFDSLHRETGGNYDGIKVVIVDLWEPYRLKLGSSAVHFPETRGFLGVKVPHIHVSPKPCVWQGDHRLTEEDWFAASNARNTAICLAPDGWIAFVDDLSVLLPGWFAAVREAMAGPQNKIICGSYRKVLKLEVADGNVKSFDDHPGGHDNRAAHVTGSGPHPCAGNWLYGCSLAAPVEAFLGINGFPEALCDGLGFEDVIAGIMLEKRGYTFAYDRRMMTYESEELHAQLPVMKRSDYGVSPEDKSHAVLRIAQQGDGWHPNYFGPEGLRGLRQRVLAGEPFPVMQIPQHEWWTGTPLKDL